MYASYVHFVLYASNYSLNLLINYDVDMLSFVGMNKISSHVLHVFRIGIWKFFFCKFQQENKLFYTYIYCFVINCYNSYHLFVLGLFQPCLLHVLGCRIGSRRTFFCILFNVHFLFLSRSCFCFFGFKVVILVFYSSVW